jgi:hypothetical protein
MSTTTRSALLNSLTCGFLVDASRWPDQAEDLPEEYEYVFDVLRCGNAVPADDLGGSVVNTK